MHIVVDELYIKDIFDGFYSIDVYNESAELNRYLRFIYAQLKSIKSIIPKGEVRTLTLKYEYVSIRITMNRSYVELFEINNEITQRGVMTGSDDYKKLYLGSIRSWLKQLVESSQQLTLRDIRTMSKGLHDVIYSNASLGKEFEWIG